MKLDSYHNVYFIGIGGIGMSALARWFVHNGFTVTGYDRIPTRLTDQLINEGIEIHYEDSVANIPSEVSRRNDAALIIYTPAIPTDHAEFNYFKDSGYTLLKRSQVLGLISQRFFTVAVAGTHGKTTTSSMIAHILSHANRDITAFLGGIATNYKSNFIANKGEDAVAIVEADEFDRSFLTLYPDLAVVTSSDADHLDIYGDKDKLQDSFKEFINRLRVNGKLFINEKIADQLIGSEYDKTVCTYGINRGQFFASNITINNGFFEFDFKDNRNSIAMLKLGTPGFHNVENATVAIAIGLELGLDEEEIRRGIETYRGVKRRFEYIIKNENVIFVDDYAHHPVEIEAFLSSLKVLFPDKKVTVIFQPHLYSRTRDFALEFAKSLDLADQVVLLDIYPAREQPIDGVTSEMICTNISIKEKVMCSKEGLIDCLENRDLEVVATVGAGDIDQLVQPVKEYLKNRYYA